MEEIKEKQILWTNFAKHNNNEDNKTPVLGIPLRRPHTFTVANFKKKEKKHQTSHL